MFVNLWIRHVIVGRARSAIGKLEETALQCVYECLARWKIDREKIGVDLETTENPLDKGLITWA